MADETKENAQADSGTGRSAQGTAAPAAAAAAAALPWYKRPLFWSIVLLALIGLLVVVLVVVAACVLIWHTANARNRGALKQNAEGSGAVLIPMLTAGAIIYGVNRIFGVGDWVTRTFLS